MRKLRCILLLGIVAVSTLTLTGLMTPASAGLELAKTSEKTIGKTTINWTSSFQDLDYTLGDTITMNVTWIVEAGVAEYYDFRKRRPYFTPKGRDPANGTAPTVIAYKAGPITVNGSGWVEVEFEFTDLHWSEKHIFVDGEWISAYIGNAKFKLYLTIDRDGDGNTDVLVGYGVNVHVEDFTTPGP